MGYGEMKRTVWGYILAGWTVTGARKVRRWGLWSAQGMKTSNSVLFSSWSFPSSSGRENN